MKLETGKKLGYLIRAIEIANNAATQPTTGENLADIIQRTYDKMVEIAEDA